MLRIPKLLALSGTAGLFCSLVIFGLLPSCIHKSDSTPTPNVLSQAKVVGMVLTDDQKPVAGAAILANGIQYATSDAYGAFTVTAAPVVNGRCVLTAQANGYFQAIRAFKAQGSTDAVILTLAPRDNHVQINASSFTTSSTTIKDAAGFQLDFPANAFAKGSSVLISGAVDVYYRYLSPKDDNLGLLMPGGDFMGKAADSSSVSLISYGAVMVDLEQGGQSLELAPGKTATLRFPANGFAQSTIPLWHFDEARAIWIQAGKARLNGGFYEGVVSHFSTYNIDTLLRNTLTIKGKVLDCDSSPLKFLEIKFGQLITYTYRDGGFTIVSPGSFFPPAFSDINLKCLLFEKWLTIDSTSIRRVGSTQTLDLGSKIVCVRAPSYARGKLTDCNQTNGEGLLQMFGTDGKYRSSTFTDGSGSFQFSSLPAQSVSLITRNLNGRVFNQSVTFPNSALETLDLGSINVCTSAPAIGGPGLSCDIYDYNSQLIRKVFFSEDSLSSASYSAKLGNNTRLFLYMTSKNLFDVQIPGHGVGVYNLVGTPGFQMYLPNGTTIPDGFSATATNITFTISEFDSVGGRIKGTFSGAIRQTQDYSGPLLNDIPLRAYNGSFNLLRAPDK
jgi:hypothetical protein